MLPETSLMNTPFRALPSSRVAGGIDADVCCPATRLPGRAAAEVDAVAGVARDDVAGAGDGPADRVISTQD